MKKLFSALLCLLLMSGLYACGAITPRENGMKSDPIAEVLRSYPIEFMGSHFQEFTRYYALHTIDGNEVLLLGVEERGTIFLDVIYVIQNDTAIQQERIMWGGGLRWASFPPALFENGTIRVGNDMDADSALIFRYYRFDNSELRPRVRLIKECDIHHFYSYPSQERIQITREEFERRKQEMEGNGQTIEIDWRPLSEFGR